MILPQYPIIFSQFYLQMTLLYSADQKIYTNYLVVNYEISDVIEWLNTNRLSLDIDKTHSRYLDPKVKMRDVLLFIKMVLIS